MLVRRVVLSGCVAAQAVLVGVWFVAPPADALMACLLALGGEASSIAGLSVLGGARRPPRRAASFTRDCTVLALVAWAVGLVVAIAQALAEF